MTDRLLDPQKSSEPHHTSFAALEYLSNYFNYYKDQAQKHKENLRHVKKKSEAQRKTKNHKTKIETQTIQSC